MYKRQHGFSGHLGQLAALSSLPGDSPAASSALPATKSAPEKLLRTCRQDKTGAGKEEDEGGLAPTEDDDAASADFSRWQAYCLLYTEGRIHEKQDNCLVLIAPTARWILRKRTDAQSAAVPMKLSYCNAY